jgi:WD40 repeat protein
MFWFGLAVHEAEVNALAISPNGRWLATGSKDGTVWLWNLTIDYPATESLMLPSYEAPVLTLTFSPDSLRLAAGSDDGKIRLWDLTTDYPANGPLELPGHEGPVKAPGNQSERPLAGHRE